MSFTKDREHLLSRQLSICTQSDEVIVNSKSICKDEISSKPEVNEVQSNTPNEEVSSQLTDSKEDDPKRKKIHSENEHANIHQNNDRISFSGRAARSNSKRSSLEMKTANEQKDSFRKPRLNMLSSSNSSRSKSKEKASFALTMNPISTTNFKYAIGNLPIKVSRDDDMLFSFRNQVMTNRSIKESETNQLPESINSRHGKITYLLTSLEDTVSQFLCDMKLWVDSVAEWSDDPSNIKDDSDQDSTEHEFVQNKSDMYYDEDDVNSLVTLLDWKDFDQEIDDQFDDYMDEEQFDERNKDKDKLNISDSITKAKSIEPKTNMTGSKNNEHSLNFSTIDPMKISKSSTTPKSRGKKIRPQISILKSAKSTRATLHSSKKSTKSKNQHQTSKTAERKRKVGPHDESKLGGRRRVNRISKKSMDRVCSNPNDNSGGKFFITSPNNSNSGRGAIKFFSLKKNSSRNDKTKDKLTSVSTNRPWVKKSNILQNSKGSSSGRLEVSSKSQNNRKARHISFYPAPQSLRIKREEEPRLEGPETIAHLNLAK